MSEGKNKRICLILFFIFLAAVCLCTGCGIQKTGSRKLRDLEYTVLEEQDIPQELRKKIEEKKADNFKMSYILEDSLYIARGFGMQETGGYSIQVRECYLAENAVYFGADLIGPKNGEEKENVVSYPYIVIQTERLEEPVIFEE